MLNRESAVVFSLCADYIAHRTDVLESKAINIVGDGPYVTGGVDPTCFPATVTTVRRYT